MAASAQSKTNSTAKQPAKVAGAAAANPAVPAEPSSQESPAAKLPVRRVILYKTGVGYFEHLGQVRGDQQVRVDFTCSDGMAAISQQEEYRRRRGPLLSIFRP